MAISIEAHQLCKRYSSQSKEARPALCDVDLSVQHGQLYGLVGPDGAGKTTLAAVLVRLFADEGHNVLAVDEDPQQNLIFSLGFPMERAEEIVPISRNLEYIEEKTGARPGESWGVMLNLNPDVPMLWDVSE